MKFEIIEASSCPVNLQAPQKKIITEFEKLNPPREDGYPKIVEITRKKDQSFYKINVHDEYFNKPLKS